MKRLWCLVKKIILFYNFETITYIELTLFMERVTSFIRIAVSLPRIVDLLRSKSFRYCLISIIAF